VHWEICETNFKKDKTCHLAPAWQLEMSGSYLGRQNSGHTTTRQQLCMHPTSQHSEIHNEDFPQTTLHGTFCALRVATWKWLQFFDWWVSAFKARTVTIK